MSQRAQPGAAQKNERKPSQICPAGNAMLWHGLSELRVGPDRVHRFVSAGKTKPRRDTRGSRNHRQREEGAMGYNSGQYAEGRGNEDNRTQVTAKAQRRPFTTNKRARHSMRQLCEFPPLKTLVSQTVIFTPDCDHGQTPRILLQRGIQN